MTKGFLLVVLLSFIIIGVSAVFFLKKNTDILENTKKEMETVQDLKRNPEDYFLQSEFLGIRVSEPAAGELVSSPLIIKGEAKGPWYFEGSFVVTLFDGNGKVIVKGPATAKGDAYTENYVPFEARLEFTHPTTENGILLLENADPSGLPELQKQFPIPVSFK